MIRSPSRKLLEGSFYSINGPRYHFSAIFALPILWKMAV